MSFVQVITKKCYVGTKRYTISVKRGVGRLFQS
jgi:hypothetical protein